MRTTKPHRQSPRQQSSSEKSDASRREVALIRAALVARRSSLRAWAIAWGRAQGIEDQADLDRVYGTVRMTVQRWAHRADQPPRTDSQSARIMRDLRRDLGLDADDREQER